MKLRSVEINEFLNLAEKLPILDARSEGEYEYGHIPGAFSFPILNNEERTLVGTCYKEKGHQAAVILGYELVGGKFHQYIKKAYELFPKKNILVHCFRGGLRSRILSDLLHSAGFDITLLNGGYKSYRQYVLQTCNMPLKLKVLGGYTGSAKTVILHRLKAKGLQVLDIEALANHRGSAYGNIAMPAQPTQEHFENILADDIVKLDHSKTIWIEDESRMTGMIKMPDALYDQLRMAPLYFIKIPFEQRMEKIIKEYGQFDRQLLIDATQKLKKRLGDLRMRDAVGFLEQGNYQEWLKIVLAYYDKTYLYGIMLREKDDIIDVTFEGEELMNYLSSQ